ncbi:MAG: glycosyltransferase family 2 protein [Reyranella sp.]|nr:glycosyltransferase family 2 protein [Reyranella sp.]
MRQGGRGQRDCQIGVESRPFWYLLSVPKARADKISLIVPVFNEAPHLAKLLAALDRVRLPRPCELVIVNDGSADQSSQIIRRFAFTNEVLIIDLPANRGKGAAVAAGIARATGTIIGIQDADFEYDFNEIARLVEPIVTGQADVVYGSRFAPGVPPPSRGIHYLANRTLTCLSNLCSGLRLTDMETCYKFFRADIIKNVRLESERYGFEPEVTAKIARLRVRLVELPTSYAPRSRGDGKKIGWRDGVAAIWHVLYFNLVARRTGWFAKDLPTSFRP